MKEFGILMPISSLYNDTGIGSLGKCSYEFIDFLKESNQKYWQILPIGHTSYGDSPYQTYSIYAGNPYFIDLKMLAEDGLLDQGEIIYYNNDYIDYGFLYNTRFNILRKAYSRFNLNNDDYQGFINRNLWVKDYALFMTIKGINNGNPLSMWNDQYKFRENNTIQYVEKMYKNEINFWIFIQYEFYNQWYKLKKYANDKGIKIIGDIPIYVPYDSVEIWVMPEMFMVNERLEMTFVSGAPADSFSPNGQIWGSPLYNYEKMRNNNYKWWTDRILNSLKVFDLIRLDHFIGFSSFFAIDAKTRNALEGKWINGPGYELFSLLDGKINPKNVIAEDLGHVTEEVKKLLKQTGFYRMKILQFAFNGDNNNVYLPKNYNENDVCYTGTHDNQTLKEWYYSLDYNTKEYVKREINFYDEANIVNGLIRYLYTSKASITIVPLQDYLKLGSEARMNIPGKPEKNWTWRVWKDALNRKISLEIQEYQR